MVIFVDLIWHTINKLHNNCTKKTPNLSLNLEYLEHLEKQ